MKSLGIFVELRQAEKIRKYLINNDLIIKSLKIGKDKKFVYIPVKKITKEINQYKKVKMDFKEIKKESKLYKKILSIPENIKQKLPTSYDVIGDIILIKLQDELLPYKKEIGEALLETNKKVRSVYLIEPVKGELRTRDLTVIAGEKKTETQHKEYGLKFHVDVSKTYFSPRLATERKRVADLVKNDEIIVDMFAGVAPFSIMMAKYAKPKIVYAIDKNRAAVNYAYKNVKENKILDKVEVIHTDAKEIKEIINKKGERVDRIIMNLPFSSYSFFKYALEIIDKQCIIHYYDILEEKIIKNRIAELKKLASKQKIILKNCKVRKIKTYAPREFYIGIDITATRNMPM
jgi:tRNA (guanine37-N1)-methyltransferase